MSKTALEEYLDLVDHETHSMESYLNGMHEGFRTQKYTGEVKQIPEVRELIEKTAREFKTRAKNLTNPEIKALSAKLTREAELQIRKIANEKTETEAKEESESHGETTEAQLARSLAKQFTAADTTDDAEALALLTGFAIGNTVTLEQRAENAALLVAGASSQLQESTILKTALDTKYGIDKKEFDEHLAKIKATGEKIDQNTIRRIFHESISNASTEDLKRLQSQWEALLKNPNLKSSLKESLEENTKQLQRIIYTKETTKLKQQGSRGKFRNRIRQWGSTIKSKFSRGGQADRNHENQPARQIPKLNIDPSTKKLILPDNKDGSQTKAPKIGPLKDFPIVPYGTEEDTTTEQEIEFFPDRPAIGNPRAKPGNINVESDFTREHTSTREIPLPEDIPPSKEDDNVYPQDYRRQRKKKKKRRGVPFGGGSFVRVGVQFAARGLMANPLFWIGVGVVLFVIVLISLFAEIDAGNRACEGTNGTTETLSVTMNGPEEATKGQQLTYTFTVRDTVAMQELTIVTQLPDGISLGLSDISSSWPTFTRDASAKTITWKASENLPAGSLSAANFTFTLTLKAISDNAHLIYVVHADPQRAGNGGGTVIVLDPGHSGTDGSRTDPATGLLDHDYPNNPEIDEVWDVAQKVKTQLEADGYTVILTKNGVRDSVSHRGRADVANNAHAALAVSIHNDHGQSWNAFASVYAQKVGAHRDTDAGQPVTFSNADVAGKSQQYAEIIRQEREAAEGRPVSNSDLNFNGRPGIAPGNIALVQLFATVPWVYNEVGAAPTGQRVPQDQIDKYAQGLINGIEKAVQSNGGGTTPNTGTSPGCGSQGAPGGSGAPPTFEDVPPTQDNCGGKYNLTNPLGNFGDPKCDFTKDALAQLIQDPTKGDPTRFQEWFNIIIPGESGYNPNAFAGSSASGLGAYGLYQMNPKSANRGLDNGSVIWTLQTSNAIQHNNNLIQQSCIFWYWSVARNAGIAQGPCR